MIITPEFTPLLWNVDIGGRAGKVYGECQDLLSVQFCGEPKTAPKISLS